MSFLACSDPTCLRQYLPWGDLRRGRHGAGLAPAMTRGVIPRGAVVASMLTAAYPMLRDGVEYRDLGADHLVKRDEAKVVERLTRRSKELGYEVEVKKAA